MNNYAKILFVACLIITISSGILRGRMDQRWVSEELVAAAERVNSTPTTLNDWTTSELKQLDDETTQMLRCTGNVHGLYTGPDDETVTMVFVVGPTGPLAIHTAEVCYGSVNFSVATPKSTKTIVDVNGREHSFSVVTLKENNAGDQLLRVYYAWSHKGEWMAPESPRFAFTGIPMLYKLQVGTYVTDDTIDEIDAAEKFLQQNLPDLHHIHR